MIYFHERKNMKLLFCLTRVSWIGYNWLYSTSLFCHISGAWGSSISLFQNVQGDPNSFWLPHLRMKMRKWRVRRKCHSLQIKEFTADIRILQSPKQAIRSRVRAHRVSYIGHTVTDSGLWNEEEGRTVVRFSNPSHLTAAESCLPEYKPNF